MSAASDSDYKPAGPLISRPQGPLRGTIQVPGDKSISHRSIIFGTLAVGETTVDGLLEAEDVLCTIDAMRACGAHISKDPSGRWHVHGVGVGGLTSPESVVDLGNSGTAARLILGALTPQRLTATLSGDASLSKRPMRRVLTPLEQMGAVFVCRDGDRLPITIEGAADPMPITYEMPVASAQVKSAILLAALNTPGTTTVIEKKATRDHTERMLRHFGVPVEVEDAAFGQRISITGQVDLTPAHVVVPGDISSAAFPIAAALLTPGSQITIENVGLNPLRDGFLRAIEKMGARIAVQNKRDQNGEPVADLEVHYGPLTGAEIPAEWAPSMIDEYPILSVLAAAADGQTVMRGLEELRVKESDRLSAMAKGLTACGVQLDELEDGLIIQGSPNQGALAGGAQVETFLDHRIAMSFLTLGLATRDPVEIDDASMIMTSFPDFIPLMTQLGARFSAPTGKSGQ